MEAIARYYDGRTSAAQDVRLRLEESYLLVSAEAVVRRDPVGELRIDPPLGTSRRLIRFADGAVCETADGAFLDRLLDLQGKGKGARQLHRWEKSLRLALTALVLTVVVIMLFIRYGVPVLASQAAQAIPLHAEDVLGRQTLATLDRMVLEQTKLPAERRRELERVFAEVAKGVRDGRTYRLEFRASDRIGANAFALPGGTIILTDELVRLARDDEDVAGVLAHEAGHVQHRHAMRHILQNSATTLIIASLTGDIVSLTSLSATLPTMLIDAKYSRDFEREADDAAVAYLRRKGLPPQRFAEMLARLDAEFRSKPGKTASVPEILSTHPETEDRIRRIVGKER